MDTMPNGNIVATQANDVWTTISKTIDAVAAYKISRNMQPQTQASPSGTISGNVWNPFPGTQSAYPQAQAKANFNAPSGDGLTLMLILGAVALVTLLFLRRG